MDSFFENIPEPLIIILVILLMILVVVLISLIIHAYISGRPFQLWPPSFGMGENKKPKKIEYPKNDFDDIDDQAMKVLKGLQIKLHKVSGSYVFNDNTVENSKTASQLYNLLSGEIIGTCFFEDPSSYGENDFAKFINTGTKFHRLATDSNCPPQSKEKVESAFKSLNCDATLTVLSENYTISKIGGIFSKLPDRSYLAFIALNNTDDNGNRGVVFCGEIAKQLFEYYLGAINDTHNNANQADG